MVIIQYQSDIKLIAEINSMIDNGWRPQGEISTLTIYKYQTFEF